MSSYMTSNAFIADVRRRAMLPSNQLTFQDSDILAFANEELTIGIIPSMMSLHEEYYVYEGDSIPLIARQTSYSIPYRAIGMKLRDLFYKDTNGTLQEMTRISADDRAYFQSSFIENRYVAYYVRGDEVVLTPNVGASAVGFLVPTYFLRPNQLVKDETVAVITAVSVDDITGLTTYSCSVPTNMTSAFNTNPGTLYDLLQTRGGHKIKKFDLTATSVSGTNLVFTTSSLPSGSNLAEVGDYFALAGECIIPQCPDELHSVLAQRVAARCLEAMGDQAGLQSANAKIQEMEVKSGILTDNRVEGSVQKVVNYGNLIRISRVRRRGWW